MGPVGVLDGVRVLDFGRYLAGPFCACLLRDLGAEVIRVERVKGGEDRFVSPMARPEGGAMSMAADGGAMSMAADGGAMSMAADGGAMFLHVNRGKRGFTVDPMKDEGREVVRRLVATADVVVANLPPRTLATMGLDHASLRAVKPDIVLTSVTAFGTTGPYADRVGFDGVGQALSGAAYMAGPPDVPSKSYVPWVDFGTASLAAFGTVAALLHRDRTGEGQHVQGSLLATAVTFADYLLIEQEVQGLDRVGSHNRGQTAAPMDIFPTSDGWIIVQAVGQPLFERWARLVGADDWITDPRFSTDELRGAHAELVSERMASWCRDRSSAAALTELAAAGVPAGHVHSPQDVLDDEHVRASGMLDRVDYPGLPRPAPVAGPPIRLGSGTVDVTGLRAPTLGEHTDEILAELGYPPEEIATLRAGGIV